MRIIITKFDVLLTRSSVFMLLWLLPYCLFAQRAEGKDERFETAVYNIITAYGEKDAETINKYVHPTNGIYFLLNENNSSYWLKRQNICLTSDCISSYNFPLVYRQKLLEQRLYSDFAIEYKKADAEAQEGLFVDKENIHALTNVMRHYRQQNSLGVSHAERREIWRIESNSKRVVLLKPNYDFWGGKFTFYLSYLNNNWYLSVIDFNN